MSSQPVYFERESATRFRPTAHVGGGWNVEEQHIAPAIGLLAHAIEVDFAERRGGDLMLSRLSCDILGILPIAPVDVEVTVLRPGRTIELVEARIAHAGRPALIARAWLTQRYDTALFEGSPIPGMPDPSELPAWDPSTVWPGGFIRSIEVRRESAGPGRAVFWLNTGIGLVADEKVSATARLLGLADTANGMATRVPPERLAFPNLDLTTHLIRPPEGEWVGFDTDVSFGPTGIGLTHSVLHDQHGPVGTVVQTLTVRPR